jgi:hypothetical protein
MLVVIVLINPNLPFSFFLNGYGKSKVKWSWSLFGNGKDDRPGCWLS